MTIPVGATHKLRGEFYREDIDSWYRLVEGQWVAVDQRSWDWVTRHAAPITKEMRQAVDAATAQAGNPLVTALRDCINVMERELNGLAVIQPELRQAREALAAAEAKPEPWDGEGRPPVGTVCEWAGPNSDGPDGWVFTESKVVAYTDCQAFVIMQKQGCWPVVQHVNNCQFRAIKTPEQIAAEERAHAIKAILDDAGVTGSAWEGDPEAEVWAAALYAAGYRKQVAP